VSVEIRPGIWAGHLTDREWESAHMLATERLYRAHQTLEKLRHLLACPGGLSPAEVQAEGLRIIADARGQTRKSA
jgi:hypothetical protein